VKEMEREKRNKERMKEWWKEREERGKSKKKETIEIEKIDGRKKRGKKKEKRKEEKSAQTVDVLFNLTFIYWCVQDPHSNNIHIGHNNPKNRCLT
jgi:hypothetical protein